MNEMEGKKPTMIIAIGLGKGPEMEDEMEDEMEESMDMEDSPRMRQGGMTKKSNGRDGCAIRGKTKGRMV